MNKYRGRRGNIDQLYIALFCNVSPIPPTHHNLTSQQLKHLQTPHTTQFSQPTHHNLTSLADFNQFLAFTPEYCHYKYYVVEDNARIGGIVSVALILYSFYAHV